ncbi:MAG: hypothetical protein JNN07_27235 [Verrucomicrobiales bacterium]|nr:hypothetical protein [Verrucomicrobiales bacterium]
MSADRDSKVIGYYGLSASQQIICTGGAALVAGSEAAVRKFVEEYDAAMAQGCFVHKIRFGDMLPGLHRGAPYAFDEVSYARFYPVAAEVGLPVTQVDFAAAQAQGHRFLIFQLRPAEDKTKDAAGNPGPAEPPLR